MNSMSHKIEVNTMKQVRQRTTSKPAGHDCDTSLHFRTSSFCNAGNCIAVASRPDGGVLIRDTKDATKEPLAFTRSEWAAFVKGAKQGKFDAEQSDGRFS